MKALIIGNETRYRKYMPDFDIVKETEMVFCPLGTADHDILKLAGDADFILADAIAEVSQNLITNMPDLKLIQSEGVGYNRIDVPAARNKGVIVCNNKGINAGAVAEQTILLMLALLRDAIVSDRKVREGFQIQTKEKMMVEGITELADCKIGLIGFGDIARATARRLLPFECEIYYYTRSRLSEAEEQDFQVQYLDLPKMAQTCNIISLHIPVTTETEGMINAEFLKSMKPNAFLINTARGEIVDNDAMRDAIAAGEIRGAAFDTVYPEPTPKDHILLNLPGNYGDRVIFSPHIGGITRSTFLRAHKNIWKNVEAVSKGEKPINIVS
jgi:Lactate dehydrogenase and related dehydrogenases